MLAYACFGPTYESHDLSMQVEGHFGHFISKNRFFFSHLKGYIFHFNTPQVNMISNWALNWPCTLELGHYWGMGARIVKGTKCVVYIFPSFDS